MFPSPRSPISEQFEAFAESCGIQHTAEPVGLAPRDLTASLDQAELHYLVTLTLDNADVSVRLVFAKPMTDTSLPTPGEVLWWLAGDAFALAQSDGGLVSWAHSYGLPPEAEGTARLFEQHRGQCDALRSLLGDVGYRRLVGIYELEMVGSQ